MKNIKFSYYSGDIKASASLGLVSLDYFIKANKNPKSKTIIILNKIARANDAGDMKLKRKLKHKLYSFTPSVIIPKGYNRSYTSIYDWTGLMQLDFDKINSVEETIELKKTLFNDNKEIICSYLSPSGKGVKCLMKITRPSSKEHYKAIHKAMVNRFEQYSYLDLSTNNAVLPLFLSADYNILYREYNDCVLFDNEDWNKPKYINLNTLPSKTSFVNNNYNYNKTVRLLTNKINNIIDNGHPQVRNASLILGSRIGVNYIDKLEAEIIIVNLIQGNNYLSKDISGYIRTAMWAINEGTKNPKYY